jgi:hypothetical protein
MKKTMLIVLIVAVTAAAGAFADVGFGVIGALYMDDAEWAAATGYSVAHAFRNGEGIYYGLMGEFMGENISLGGAYMASFYNAVFDPTIPMVDMDMNVYLGGHFLGTRKVLDPFVEAGLGYIFKDYADDQYDDDPSNPLTRTAYWYLGAGLGANLGPVGFFGKFIYHIPFERQLLRRIRCRAHHLHRSGGLRPQALQGCPWREDHVPADAAPALTAPGPPATIANQTALSAFGGEGFSVSCPAPFSADCTFGRAELFVPAPSG